MSRTAPFPKIIHIGDKQIQDLFDDTVEITEKVDGSQFGFGKVNGELFCRSKGREIDMDNPDRMFISGVEYVKTIQDRIPDDFTFYGEYLQKPKHNSLAYDKIPHNHIALFAVNDNGKDKKFLDYDAIKHWAEVLDIDAVPLLYQGKSGPEAVLEMVKNKVSYLGGQNIEGVVVKAYKPWLFMNQIPLNVMAGKYVTEDFKEVHNKSWKAEHTNKGQLEVAISNYKSEARWNKAIQHLRDAGNLTGTPRDIGALIKEVHKDIAEEEKESIKAALWSIYNDKFMKAATEGFAQWYKEKIMIEGVEPNVQESNASPDSSSDTVGTGDNDTSV